MLTEDDLGAGLLDGSLTVADVVRLISTDDVVVYPAVNVKPRTEMWADVEDMGAGSTLFSDLAKAGATSEQMDEVGAQVERLRAEGRTLDKVYGWPESATTPEGEAAEVGPDGIVVEEPPAEGA